MGILTLGIFFGLMAASARKWIPQRVLPLQSVMALASLLFLGLSLLAGLPLSRGRLFSVTTLHPITAALAGFLLAGTVEAAGGFRAAGKIMGAVGRSRWIGLPGAVFLVVNLPNMVAMPCGRVWAAALMPLVLMLVRAVGRATDNPTLAPAVVFGFVVNAAASCGPSPLGGIGMMGEGMAGYLPHAFSNHMQWAIMLCTSVTMFASSRLYAIRVKLRETPQAPEAPVPVTAWFSCLLFFVGMTALFVVEPPVPLQAVLLCLALLIMLVGRVSLQQMVGGIAFHPLTAMIAGFMMAGALVVSGGFDAFHALLVFLAEKIPFGFLLVGALLACTPLLFPMPCGRILSTSLLPGVLMFGQEAASATGYAPALPLLLVAFLLACAGSCGPSPIGGIGGTGEGNLGLRSGASVMPQQIGLLVGVAAAGISTAVFGVGDGRPDLPQAVLLLVSGMVCAMFNNHLFGKPFWHPGGVLAGVLAGGGLLVL
jgi:hypothetical protein